jgi:phage tail-like protein
MTTFFRIDGRQGSDPTAGWRSESANGIEFTASGLSLKRLPSPPVLLKDPAGTFGGLETPTGVAVAADGTIYVSDLTNDLIFAIRRCGASDPTIEYLRCLGGKGKGPREFREPRGLAVSTTGDLYVADSLNNRIQVFALRGSVLRTIWSGRFKNPWDVAVDAQGNVFVADKGNGRVQKFICRTGKFQIVDGRLLHAHVFQVRYGSSAGARFAFVQARTRLEQWPDTGGDNPGLTNVIRISDSIRTVDEARALVLTTIDAAGSTDILIEWETTYPKPLAAGAPEPPFDAPTHLAIDSSGRLYVVDENKDYVKVLDPDGRVIEHVTYVDETGKAFAPAAVTVDADGNLLVADANGIQRFRVEGGSFEHAGTFSSESQCSGLALTPEGNIVTAGGDSGVSEVGDSPGFIDFGTYYSSAFDADIEACQWHRIAIDSDGRHPAGTSVQVWTYSSDTLKSQSEIAALSEDDWLTSQTNASDFLILSGPGRYLWIRIEIVGNTQATPRLKGMTVYFPRQTYLQYLPAMYQTDPAAKDFLERFLSIFEATNSSFEGLIEHMPAYFDAYGVPAEFLDWLASWVDMTFHSAWDLSTRRRLLRESADLYRVRGTPAGLKRMVEVAMGLKIQILENFRLRRWLLLNGGNAGGGSELWGGCQVPRLQLDENSRIGEFALIGTPDPEHDPFLVYAHQFIVFVPASQVLTAEKESMLRWILDSDKPAHTTYEFRKVEARFRVGVQSIVGMDTIVGGYPHIVLNHCSTLGYDTLLNCPPEESAHRVFQIREHSRVGIDAVVG